MARLNKYERDRKFIEKRLKEIKRLDLGRCVRYSQQLAKRHPLDCGKPGCMICHSTKILGQKTHKQEIEDLRFHDELSD
jgi:hypothetical protein